MTDAALPHFERPSAVGFLAYATALIVIFWCLSGAGFSLENVATAPPRFADFDTRAFPPNLEPDVLVQLCWKMVETQQIAVAGPSSASYCLCRSPCWARVG